MDAILTLDLGTTALKATLFGLDGSVLAQRQQEYPTQRPQPGWAEQDPDDWWDAVVRAVRSLIGARPVTDRRPMAIGLTSQREGVVPVDDRGQPLARCIIWMDRRSQPEAEELARLFPDLHRRTGMIPDATFTAARALWLRRHAPEVMEGAAWLLQPRDYLYYRLTGTAVTDPSLASRTMLFDLRDGRWAPDLLEATGVRADQFPPLVPSATAPAVLSAEAAAALGLDPGIPIAAGGGDRPCEVLGSGARDGRPMESTGTTTNVSLPTTRHDSVPAGILVSAHVVPGQYVFEQGLTASGAILQWLGTLLAPEEGATTFDRAARSEPGARGLLFLPHVHGARAPWWNPDARAGWAGFTLAHTADDIARSVLEAIAFDARACLEALERLGHEIREVVLVGGGAKSRVWAAIKANIWRKPVVVPSIADAASLGAMILAGAAVGIWSVREGPANPPSIVIEPEAAAADRYDQAYHAYRDLYAQVNAQARHHR